MEIVIDLDETLIGNRIPIHPRVPVLTYSMSGFWDDRIMLRPGAREFLENCTDVCDHVVLGTYSSRSRAKAVVAALGFDGLFDLIVSHEDFSSNDLALKCGEFEGIRLSDFVLLDDQDLQSPLVQSKLTYFGVDPDDEDFGAHHFIQVPPFQGRPDDDVFQRVHNALKGPRQQLPHVDLDLGVDWDALDLEGLQELGHSVPDIADMIGVSRSTVYRHLLKCRKAVSA